MVSGSFTQKVEILGRTIQRNTTPSDDEQVMAEPDLAAAKAGALTTRTDANTGTLTMAGGHGILTGNRLDIYWVNADGTVGRRYGVTVGTVATNSVPIDLGAGDDLPALVSGTYAITAMVPVSRAFVVPAADLTALFVTARVAATVVFTSDTPATVLAVSIDSATDGYIWTPDGGAATPFGDDVVTVYLSHADSSTTRTVTAIGLQ